ncbi:SHOCT domain-containing protein [Trueperella pyogenes]
MAFIRQEILQSRLLHPTPLRHQGWQAMTLINTEARTRATLNIARQLLTQGHITQDEYQAVERRLVAKYSAKISGLNLPKPT